MTPQVCEVAFHIGIAPGADEDVRADLVDDARIGLGERFRPQLNLVEDRVVLEALGGKHADAAAAENVIEEECRLAQTAAGLKVLEVEVLETAEGACLQEFGRAPRRVRW